MPTQENNNSDEESINSGDHATSYERHRERNSKKTTTKDVSGVNIGNLSQLIKKKKGADDDDNFDELEKKRKEAQALIKSAELREKMEYSANPQQYVLRCTTVNCTTTTHHRASPPTVQHLPSSTRRFKATISHETTAVDVMSAHRLLVPTNCFSRHHF